MEQLNQYQEKNSVIQLKRTRNKNGNALTKKKAKVVDEKNGDNKKNGDDEANGCTERFNFNVTLEELDSFKEGICPENTAKSIEWALRNFETWRNARNDRHPEDLCASDLFTTGSCEEICEWLCKFISETRKADGTEYTPCSL